MAGLDPASTPSLNALFSKKFFFEKKNQKTFLNLGHGSFHQNGLL
jgi:hypothetical protein